MERTTFKSVDEAARFQVLIGCHEERGIHAVAADLETQYPNCDGLAAVKAAVAWNEARQSR